MRALINIDVPELDSAIRFYTSALGLRFIRKLDDDVAELTGASSTIYLLVNAAGSTATALGEKRQYSRHWTPVHIDFVVEDVAQAAKQALSAGAKQESLCVEWRGSKCITFSDPYGHGFCLIEFTAETYLEQG